MPHTASREKYTWQFPLPRTHTGMLLGNGVMGVMIWGQGNTLCITFNRADFWDHRGGRHWLSTMNFPAIRQCLESNDESGIRRLFNIEPPAPGQPDRSSMLPLGRIELVFDPHYALDTGVLDLATGAITVRLTSAAGHTHAVHFNLAMDRPLLHIQLPGTLAAPSIRRVTAWDYPKVAQHLEKISIERPIPLSAPGLSGWVQKRPAPQDPPLCVGWRMDPQQLALWLAVDYGATPEAAQAAVAAHIANADAAALRAANESWWNAYWSDAPQVHLPDEQVNFLYNYGMYKFAGLTTPGGVAAGLQGPWVEEYQMPPWSADYHFNINVQMCYQPAFAGNRLEHLRPLFDLIDSWMPVLRENARKFVGVDDGLVLPHAVNDKCEIIGAFWTGTIDHACTAWVGKMMYDYWRFGGADDTFLRDRIYPYLRGTMRVYEAMLERQPDGTFALPVSVSPEYRGSQMNAWGRDASFQLACIHWLLGALQDCCRRLAIAPKPLWADIAAGLPQACINGGDNRRIMLWQGTDLEESHRHHSHLGAITPFETIDPADPQWSAVVRNSMNHWIHMGMGLWTGWCMPWAVMLHHRFGNPDMATMLIEIWRRVFTNVGHGTLHDCNFPGFTLMGAGGPPRGEIMQMDAGMGMVAAILDGLAHVRNDTLYLFTGSPASWRDVSFSNIRLPGAFLVSATRRAGMIESIRLHSERGNTLKLHNPWPKARLKRATATDVITDTILTLTTHPGEILTLEAPGF